MGETDPLIVVTTCRPDTRYRKLVPDDFDTLGAATTPRFELDLRPRTVDVLVHEAVCVSHTGHSCPTIRTRLQIREPLTCVPLSQMRVQAFPRVSATCLSILFEDPWRRTPNKGSRCPNLQSREPAQHTCCLYPNKNSCHGTPKHRFSAATAVKMGVTRRSPRIVSTLRGMGLTRFGYQQWEPCVGTAPTATTVGTRSFISRTHLAVQPTHFSATYNEN